MNKINNEHGKKSLESKVSNNFYNFLIRELYLKKSDYMEIAFNLSQVFYFNTPKHNEVKNQYFSFFIHIFSCLFYNNNFESELIQMSFKEVIELIKEVLLHLVSKKADIKLILEVVNFYRNTNNLDLGISVLNDFKKQSKFLNNSTLYFNLAYLNLIKNEEVITKQIKSTNNLNVNYFLKDEKYKQKSLLSTLEQDFKMFVNLMTKDEVNELYLFLNYMIDLKLLNQFMNFFTMDKVGTILSENKKNKLLLRYELEFNIDKVKTEDIPFSEFSKIITKSLNNLTIKTYDEDTNESKQNTKEIRLLESNQRLNLLLKIAKEKYKIEYLLKFKNEILNNVESIVEGLSLNEELLFDYVTTLFQLLIHYSEKILLCNSNTIEIIYNCIEEVSNLFNFKDIYIQSLLVTLKFKFSLFIKLLGKSKFEMDNKILIISRINTYVNFIVLIENIEKQKIFNFLNEITSNIDQLYNKKFLKSSFMLFSS